MNNIHHLTGKQVLAVCLPLIDGKLSWRTMFALREEEQLLAATGLPWRIDIVVQEGCSLIAHARNEALAHAFKRGADAILWVDSDIDWDTGTICKWLALGVDMVGAAVPRRTRDLTWNVAFLEEPVRVDRRGLLEVESVGTGLLLTKRAVYERISDAGPAYYRSAAGHDAPAYFETGPGVGEDINLCRRWREASGQVWVDPDVAVSHVIAPGWSVDACLAQWLKEKAA